MRFYVNDYLFIIQPTHTSKQTISNDLSIFSAADISQIMDYYQLVKAGRVQGKTTFVFKVKDYEKIVTKIKKQFKLIEAAGGIVEKGNEILLIHRLNKWDLPKGKVEKGESIEIAAIREVEEECMVKAELIDKIGQTWHTYELKGKDILKCTHWFRMLCKSDIDLKPQIEEAIDDVKWLQFEDAVKLLHEESYASISSITAQYAEMKAK